jgi:hypothetical protein
MTGGRNTLLQMNVVYRLLFVNFVAWNVTCNGGDAQADSDWLEKMEARHDKHHGRLQGCIKSMTIVENQFCKLLAQASNFQAFKQASISHIASTLSFQLHPLLSCSPSPSSPPTTLTMRFSSILATLAAITPTILALPTGPTDPTNPTDATPPLESNATTSSTAVPVVTVKNHCSFPVYITSVGGTGSQGPTKETPPRGNWMENQYWSGTGTAVKVTRTVDGLYTGAPILILGYSYNAGVSLYYDLGLHGGNPFEGYNVKLSGAGGDNVWDPVPKPQQTRGYWGTSDLTLDICF